jgi:hypothetical protein
MCKVQPKRGLGKISDSVRMHTAVALDLILKALYYIIAVATVGKFKEKE